MRQLPGKQSALADTIEVAATDLIQHSAEE